MHRIATALILLITTAAYAETALVFTGSANPPRVHAIGDPCPTSYRWSSQRIDDGTFPTDNYQGAWNEWTSGALNEAEIPTALYAAGLPLRHRYSCDDGATWSDPSAWYVVKPLRGDVNNDCAVGTMDSTILNMNFGNVCQ